MTIPKARSTVWVLGDQLNTACSALSAASPATHRVLMVESDAKLTSKRWHVQRAHLVITAMRRFADELRSDGWDVDYRKAPTLADGLAAHRVEHAPPAVSAMEPASRAGWNMLERHDVQLVRTNQFLCHPDEFAAWADGSTSLRMEDFYRWQRHRLGYLMDGNEPATGRWNYDAENRETARSARGKLWPEPLTTELDDVDRAVLADLADLAGGRVGDPGGSPSGDASSDRSGGLWDAAPTGLWGAEPTGLWATSRAEALRRLEHVVEHLLPVFGPHEDTMLESNWHLAHAMLAQYLNLSLLHPSEVCDMVDDAYRAGHVPIGSAEGFIRQIIGWREYVWGVYWLWSSEYRDENVLDAHRALPPVLTGQAATEMRCVEHTMQGLHDHGWVHHIQRLMILGNLALLAGVEPQAMTEWMWASFVDGAEWVMVPNVVGMALHADGGRMATKPYAAGGAYIDRMSDHCRSCRYDRRKRTGPDACPFTTLYWDFLARHETRLAGNHRMARQISAARGLADMDAVRERAAEVLQMLDDGEL